jgi:hypothetical protein
VVSRIEGTNRIPSKLPKLSYPSHQAITVVEGAFRVDVGEYAQEVQTGQTIFFPLGMQLPWRRLLVMHPCI